MKPLALSLVLLLAGGLSATAADLEFDAFPNDGKRSFTLFEDDTGLIERGGGEDTGHELGDISVGGSAGIALSNLGFLATAEADFWITRFFSLGPLVQVVGGEDFVFAVGGGPKITFDFDDNDFSNLVKPYIHAGPGFVIVSGDHPNKRKPRHRTEVGFLVTLGLGVDFYVVDHLSLGTGFLFNFMPTTPLDDVFYFGWKVIEAKYHF